MSVSVVAPLVCTFFNASHSDWCEMGSICRLSLYFPQSYSMLNNHPYFVFLRTVCLLDQPTYCFHYIFWCAALNWSYILDTE